MHRSSSVSRESGELLVDISDSHILPLPIHHSLSDVTKKEITLNGKPPIDKTIHLIPLVLLVCALILIIDFYARD
ncbi:hypothetical protein Fmac_012777 [Flemingia macrophylla]|uniref:Uncharacterized protein n=1 Tax=Flemingia macrophylla TaxID=520843 RepID=A0ABD1MR95_9FABA